MRPRVGLPCACTHRAPTLPEGAKRTLSPGTFQGCSALGNPQQLSVLGPPPSDAQPPLPPEAGPLPGCPPHRSFTRHPPLAAGPAGAQEAPGLGQGARAHLEALGVEALLAVSGHLQPRVQAPHQRLGVADVLEVAVGAEVQHLHGLGDVLHLHGTGGAKPLTTPPNEDLRAGEMWGGQAAPWRHRVRPPSPLHHGRRCHNAPPLTAQL